MQLFLKVEQLMMDAFLFDGCQSPKTRRIEVLTNGLSRFCQCCAQLCFSLFLRRENENLWELGMICLTSEAICETVRSIMNQHSGKKCHLEPEYFSMELVLRFNLGPIHPLDDFVCNMF